MFGAIVRERNRGRMDRGPVQRGGCDALVPALGIPHLDPVAAAAVVPEDAEALPRRGHARRHGEARAQGLQAEDRLEPQPVHPRGGAGVPRPAAAADVRVARVDVCGDHERLRLVALHIGGRARVVDGIQHVEQLDRLVAVAELRQGPHRPQRRVRVLAAVLAHAGEVALDIAGLEGGLVERRGEQRDHARISPHELRSHSVHGALGVRRRRRAGEHGPALRDGVDAALGQLRGAERRAVVEVGAPVPVSVPRLLEHGLEPLAFAPPAVGSGGVAARGHDRAEIAQNLRHEPAEPHALAAAAVPDTVHAVVPVAGADQRQAVGAPGEPALDRANAVLVERRAFGRHLRLAVVFQLPRLELGCLQERHLHVQHGAITRGGHVMGPRVGQPQHVVGAPRAHAAARVRVPPVLHVAREELAGGAAEQVLAIQVGPCEAERHHVLELVAEAVRAAGLEEARPPPEPRADRLVEEPAVHDQVERVVRRFDLHRAEDRVPVPLDLLLGHAGSLRVAEALRQDEGVRAIVSLAQEQHDLPRLAGLQVHANLQRRARVEAGAEALPQRHAAERRRAAQ